MLYYTLFGLYGRGGLYGFSCFLIALWRLSWILRGGFLQNLRFGLSNDTRFLACLWLCLRYQWSLMIYRYLWSLWRCGGPFFGWNRCFSRDLCHHFSMIFNSWLLILLYSMILNDVFLSIYRVIVFFYLFLLLLLIEEDVLRSWRLRCGVVGLGREPGWRIESGTSLTDDLLNHLAVIIFLYGCSTIE